jgi:hypothetical protein
MEPRTQNSQEAPGARGRRVPIEDGVARQSGAQLELNQESRLAAAGAWGGAVTSVGLRTAVGQGEAEVDDGGGGQVVEGTKRPRFTTVGVGGRSRAHRGWGWWRRAQAAKGAEMPRLMMVGRAPIGLEEGGVAVKT